MDAIQLQLKVGKKVTTVTLNVDRRVEYTVKLDPDEAGGTVYALPGLNNPKFIAVSVEGYQRGMPPVEVALQENGDRVACTPFTILTADVIEGMQEDNFGGQAPALRFYNWTDQEVTIVVTAGE
ncbi:MAG: hypothetical protein GY832_15410 [Chloroflexi bacterium]|nr:hypothetical protein [Chloroflexota bacterium]